VCICSGDWRWANGDKIGNVEEDGERGENCLMFSFEESRNHPQDKDCTEERRVVCMYSI